MAHEDESFADAKKRIRKATQGKYAQDKVQEHLTQKKATQPLFDFERLLDMRSCGRPVPPTVADFVGCIRGRGFALEVKETEHDFRLNLKDFPQYPRMMRRASAGAQVILAVFHKQTKLWRVVDVTRLEQIRSGSWDLSRFETYEKFTQAIEGEFWEWAM